MSRLRALDVAAALLCTGCATLLGIDDWDSGAASGIGGAPSGSGPAASSAATGGQAGAGATSSTSTGAAGAPGYFDVVMADAPVAYWRLGEKVGGTAIDAVGGHNGLYKDVLLDQPGALAGDPDRAVSIDAAKGGVLVSDTLDFAGNSPFSIEAWVSPNTLDGSARRILEKGDPTPGTRQGYSLIPSSNGVKFERWKDNLADWTAAGRLAASVYSHIAATFDGSTMRIYINGQPVGQTSSSVLLDDTSFPVVIGADAGGEAHLGGLVDEVAVYDKALPPARVQAHYAMGMGAK